jgi:hypothetical protein
LRSARHTAARRPAARRRAPTARHPAAADQAPSRPSPGQPTRPSCRPARPHRGLDRFVVVVVVELQGLGLDRHHRRSWGPITARRPGRIHPLAQQHPPAQFGHHVGPQHRPATRAARAPGPQHPPALQPDRSRFDSRQNGATPRKPSAAPPAQPMQFLQPIDRARLSPSPAPAHGVGVVIGNRLSFGHVLVLPATYFEN